MAHVEVGLERMAIYEAEPDQSPESVIYKYLRTAPRNEAVDYLDNSRLSGGDFS
jgi:hypothetical protein